MSKFTLNTQEAIGDIRKYSKETQRLVRNEMDTQAWILKGEQRDNLYTQIRAAGNLPTGFLGSTMGVDRKRDTWEVGPDINRANYAQYVESGHHSFKGYWYVRNTFKPRVKKVIAALRKIVDR